ncbi:hypothetical protein ACK36D_15530 [Aeromonas veronii]
MEKQLKDFTLESNEIELYKKIDEITAKSEQIVSWITNNIDRANNSLILTNLLSSTSSYLNLLKIISFEHISLLALSTRNIYELNVRTRAVIELPEELNKWQSEAVTDKLQIIEGILTLTTESSCSQKIKLLEDEMTRLKNLLQKYNLPIIKNPEASGSLAKKIGLQEEHVALFKLFSKLVHPSSYLVNSYDQAATAENRMILQAHAQLYAHDTIGRVCIALQIPYAISQPYGNQ